MSTKIDECRSKLINKILFATSQNEVQSFIYIGIKELKERKVHNYVIKRFLDKIVKNLEDFIPSKYNDQQSANIRMGKIFFNRIITSI